MIEIRTVKGDFLGYISREARPHQGRLILRRYWTQREGTLMFEDLKLVMLNGVAICEDPEQLKKFHQDVVHYLRDEEGG